MDNTFVIFSYDDFPRLENFHKDLQNQDVMTEQKE